jgi:hypothetical protein
MYGNKALKKHDFVDFLGGGGGNMAAVQTFSLAFSLANHVKFGMEIDHKTQL